MVVIIVMVMGCVFIGFFLWMQDLVKFIYFSNSNFICYVFDSDVKDGYDLVIGLNSGDGKYIFEFEL